MSEKMLGYDVYATENYVNEKLAGVGNVQPNWNQNDEIADDYIKNRPFYSEVIETTSNVLTWDGNIDGLIGVEPEPGIKYFVKVSDTVLEVSDLVGGTVTIVQDGVSQSMPIPESYVMDMGNIIMTQLLTVVVKEDNAEFEGIIFPEAGIYLPNPEIAEGIIISKLELAPDSTKTFTCASEVIHKVNSKFLPINIVSGSSDGSSRTLGSVEEDENYVIGRNAFAEGFNTRAIGESSHAEGNNTTAFGEGSHTEGNMTFAIGKYSHAEGYGNHAIIRLSNMNDDDPNYSPNVYIMSDKDAKILDKLDLTTSYFYHNGIIRDAYSFSYRDNKVYLDEQFSSEPLDNAIVYVFDNGVATGDHSHAEGYGTTATGDQSHAEGDGTKASGESSHAEGFHTEASGKYSHVEGKQTEALGDYSHAEGNMTEALGNGSHAEGYGTTASGDYSHAEGDRTTALGEYSHAEGYGSYLTHPHFTITGNANSTVYTVSIPAFSIGVNIDTIISHDGIIARVVSISDDGLTITLDKTLSTTNITVTPRIVGGIAIGKYSHVEGNDTTALGENSHAEGYKTTASGENSHAEGIGTNAQTAYMNVSGSYNIIETLPEYNIVNEKTIAGFYNNSYYYELSELPTGINASGNFDLTNISHTNLGNSKFSSGMIVAYDYFNLSICYKLISLYSSDDKKVEWVVERYEVGKPDLLKGKYAHIVGNGTHNSMRSNAHTLDWEGNAWYQGDVYVGSTSGTNKDEGSKKLATEEYVNTELANLVGAAPETLDTIEELATAFQENEDVVETLNSAIVNKADKTDLEAFATEEYVDEKLSTIGIPRLVTHTFPITATEEGQTVFPIELESFNSSTDTVMVQDGRTMLFPNVDFTVVDNTVVLTEGWSVGDTGGIYVFKIEMY